MYWYVYSKFRKSSSLKFKNVPFGFPVVPDENTINAMSSSSFGSTFSDLSTVNFKLSYQPTSKKISCCLSNRLSKNFLVRIALGLESSKMEFRSGKG